MAVGRCNHVIDFLQRRSLAPSQLLKRKQGCLEEGELGNRRKQVR